MKSWGEWQNNKRSLEVVTVEFACPDSGNILPKLAVVLLWQAEMVGLEKGDCTVEPQSYEPPGKRGCS